MNKTGRYLVLQEGEAWFAECKTDSKKYAQQRARELSKNGRKFYVYDQTKNEMR